MSNVNLHNQGKVVRQWVPALAGTVDQLKRNCSIEVNVSQASQSQIVIPALVGTVVSALMYSSWFNGWPLWVSFHAAGVLPYTLTGWLWVIRNLLQMAFAAVPFCLIGASIPIYALYRCKKGQTIIVSTALLITSPLFSLVATFFLGLVLVLPFWCAHTLHVLPIQLFLRDLFFHCLIGYGSLGFLGGFFALVTMLGCNNKRIKLVTVQVIQQNPSLQQITGHES
jgi:hypothetical protein